MRPQRPAGWLTRCDALLPYVLCALVLIVFPGSDIPADQLPAMFLIYGFFALMGSIAVGVPYGLCLGLLFLGLRKLLPAGTPMSAAIVISAATTYCLLEEIFARTFTHLHTLTRLTAMLQLPCLLLLHLIHQLYPTANRKSS